LLGGIFAALRTGDRKTEDRIFAVLRTAITTVFARSPKADAAISSHVRDGMNSTDGLAPNPSVPSGQAWPAPTEYCHCEESEG